MTAFRLIEQPTCGPTFRLPESASALGSMGPKLGPKSAAQTRNTLAARGCLNAARIQLGRDLARRQPGKLGEDRADARAYNCRHYSSLDYS
jgi:hypothetical protein